MASHQSTMDFLLDLLSQHHAPVSARKMFGEYALYWQEKTVALLCDDQLYVKPTATGESLIPLVVKAVPYPGGKPWLLISADHWEESEWLADLLRQTANSLPEPKKKKPTVKKTVTKKTAAKKPAAKKVKK